MLEALKKTVCEANLLLPEYGMVTFTWGNVSAADREEELIIIKPSGVPYDDMAPEDMVVMDFQGCRVEGSLNPSSDFPTHLELYKAFPDIGGIVHTHSTFATSFAQAGLPIPCYSTTHADYFYGEVPCTRMLTDAEIEGEYEKNTGLVIIDTFKNSNITPSEMPAVIVSGHGPFCWGADAGKAVENAVVLDEVAKMAFISRQLSPGISPAPEALMDKHFFRKHGKDAYYGQS